MAALSTARLAALRAHLGSTGGAKPSPVPAASSSASLLVPSSATDQGCCVFSESFMTWDFPRSDVPDPRPNARHELPFGNKARIELEALVEMVDEETGRSDTFVLIAPCRTEWVYAPDKLFQLPSAEYRCAYAVNEQLERSLAQHLVVDDAQQRRREAVRIDVQHDSRTLDISIRRSPTTRTLDTPAAVNEASEAGIPIVCRTVIRHPDRPQVRYQLEYPVRTMNYRPEDSSFQVDTGPILVPDFSLAATGVECGIEELEMAHVAFNHRNYLETAEFLLRRPTEVPGAAGVEVLHFAERQECEATTALMALR